MEAALILTEHRDVQARVELDRLARAPNHQSDELRQAATWGLAKAGSGVYQEFLDRLNDENDAVVIHAVSGFGPDTPIHVVKELIAVIQKGNTRNRSAASKALRLIGSKRVVRALVTAVRGSQESKAWILATLGRMDPATVRSVLAGDPLLSELEPMLVLSPSENWMASSEVAEDLRFLLRQHLA